MQQNQSFIIVPLVIFMLWGVQPFADCPSADLTGDCFVDMEDLSVLAAHWLTGDPSFPDDMVYIPRGGFEMGDPYSEGASDERPLHPVVLDAFFMGRYEVTNGQYCEYLNDSGGTIYMSGGVVYGIANNQPYYYLPGTNTYSQIEYSGGLFVVLTKGGRDMSDDPVVEVTWYGAVAYCNWRSSEEGYETCYNLSTWACDFSKHGYRLATEAEWEYAARGGPAGKRFPWGDTISHSHANYYAIPGGYPYDVSPTSGYHPDWNDGIDPYTSPVGSFSANGYGLYDITGNVWEWCNDWYNSNTYDTSPYDNPTGPVSGTLRVLRGGGCYQSAFACRVAIRNNFNPTSSSHLYGFRIVLDVE